MKKLQLILLLPIALIMALSSAAFGLELGTNITIPDGRFLSGNEPWYGAQEDQEVEPGMQIDQRWDLEGFFLNNNILTLVAGYDLKKGTKDNNKKIKPGDLFFKIGGVPSESEYGYDYVFDLDHKKNTYDIYKLDGTSKFKTSIAANNNDESDPWRYKAKKSNNQKVGQSLVFQYLPVLTDADVGGMTGGSHNAMIFDLSFFTTLFDTESIDFLVHYTMECGNDNILGEGKLPIPNPEPETFLLLGLGLIGFGGLLRKQQRKVDINHRDTGRELPLPVSHALLKGITMSK